MKMKIDYYWSLCCEECNVFEYKFYDGEKHIASFEVFFIRDKAEFKKSNIMMLEDFISALCSDCVKAASYAYKKLGLNEKDVSSGALAIISESYVLPEYRNKHIFTMLLHDIIEPSSGLIVDQYKYGAVLVRFLPSNGLSLSPFIEEPSLEEGKQQIDKNLNNLNKYGWTIIPSNITKYVNNEFAYKSIASLGELHNGLTSKDWGEEFWSHGECADDEEFRDLVRRT